MIRRVGFVVLALLATGALANAQEQVQHRRHHHKMAEATKTDKASAPSDDVPLPAAAQKWFGDTVDGILSGADQTLNGRSEPKK